MFRLRRKQRRIRSPGQEDAAQAGKKLYASLCLSCHGDAGKGASGVALYEVRRQKMRLADALSGSIIMAPVSPRPLAMVTVVFYD
jgi:mono/diheme cytochrome c family protein